VDISLSLANVCFTPKADITERGYDVRFVPKADIMRCGKRTPLFDYFVGAR
jgi:hypothetical protein